MDVFSLFNLCACDKILIVDDNQFNLLAQKVIIEKYTKSVELAPGGRDALEMVQKYHGLPNCCSNYWIIILDVNMPFMDGFETCQEIWNYQRNKQCLLSNVIACTALLDRDTKDKCEKNGIKYVLQKPIAQNDLLKIMSKILSTDATCQTRIKNFY